MKYLTLHHNFKPKYYNMYGERNNGLKVIIGNHVACFFEVMMARVYGLTILQLTACFLSVKY